MLEQLLFVFSSTFSSRPSSPGGETNPVVDGDSDADIPEGLVDSDPDYGWSPRSPRCPTAAVGPVLDDKSTSPELTAKLAEDLRVAKLAGFRVGYLGDLNDPIVCISSRIGMLGISDEAMQAWKVDGRQYLVCMIRYTGRYRNLEQIIREESAFGKSKIEFHVDLCDSYKPTLANAVSCFNQSNKNTEQITDSSTDAGKSRTMTKSFISKPLNSLLNERFVKILHYRHTFGFSWIGAETFFNDIQGKSFDQADPADPKYSTEENMASSSAALPEIVTSDHLADKGGRVGASFPLILMQFVLRHFVRCTEFCLVCHCKTDNTFEALKPYVCSKSLCLYQYMALGFGPSLEWEIISQPYVVDLLVSFTYVSACQDRLRDFPNGLGILTPSPTEVAHKTFDRFQGSADEQKLTEKPYRARFELSRLELLFDDETPSRSLRSNDWIAIVGHPYGNCQLHCRIRDASLWPNVLVSKPIIRKPQFVGGSDTKDDELNYISGYQNIQFYAYDKDFDYLSTEHKCTVITMLLDTLPDIREMTKYLTGKSQERDRTLSNFADRISKSALDVLRWIVASNRSCIVQDQQARLGKETGPPANTDDRVRGVEGFLQFRFAQGAPDKEQRFLQEVAAASAKTETKYPTMFAWHGSSLSNWHGILREGLHFKHVAHGRSYGNGVYMSSHFTISAGYTQDAYSLLFSWPKSLLRVSSAIALNEVVNAPDQFVNRSPHLVVSQLDWIQPRYLFVNCEAPVWKGDDLSDSKWPAQYFEQDPKYTAIGPSASKIVIPVTAVSRKRRATITVGDGKDLKNDFTHSASYDRQRYSDRADPSFSIPGNKRIKLFGCDDGGAESQNNNQQLEQKDGLPKAYLEIQEENDTPSEDTDDEDLAILCEPDKGKGKQKVKETEETDPPQKIIFDPSKTDFVPGTLEASTLPLLAPPSFATPLATKALQRDLKATLQIQKTHPAHELGWYIDPNLINTVYQWIVELHSFDAELPLAVDMKHAGLKSIVLEILFPKDYPIAPPFVRIIRPRFLGFVQGGGGHVTAGGALCMELLTNSGWSAVSSIESVLLQVRMALSSSEPRPARLERGQVKDYRVGEAVEAYIRACHMHGWEVPKDFERSLGGQWDPAPN